MSDPLRPPPPAPEGPSFGMNEWGLVIEALNIRDPFMAVVIIGSRSDPAAAEINIHPKFAARFPEEKFAELAAFLDRLLREAKQKAMAGG